MCYLLGYGTATDGTTTYINAATCNRNYETANSPIVFKLPNPNFKSKS